MDFWLRYFVFWSFFVRAFFIDCAKYHTVRRQDTHEHLEQLYDLFAGELSRLNPGREVHWLVSGTSLCVQASVRENGSLKVKCRAFAPPAIRGHVASPHSWPWQVLIRTLPVKSASQNRSETFCGGVVLSSRTMITAAHCLYDWHWMRNGSHLKVGLGLHQRSTSPKRSPKISKISIHEKYKHFRSKANDVAIITLENPLKFSKKIKAVHLPKEGDRVCPGTVSVVTGWGSTLVRNGPLEIPTKPDSEPSHPDELRQAMVQIIDPNRCKEAYNSSFTEGMICAGARNDGIDSCDGDSGGGLVVYDSAAELHILIGIVSWGIGCGTAKNPGVYADVVHYLPWIRSKLALEEGAT